MENMEKHLVHEDDFKGNPGTLEELEESKKLAGVITHGEAMKRAKELGLEENDQKLIEKAEREIESLNQMLRMKESLLSSSVMLEKLLSFIKNKEELEKEISGTEKKIEELEDLSKKMAKMEIDTSQTIEKIQLEKSKKEQLKEIFNGLESNLPYDSLDVDFTVEYLKSIKDIKGKFDDVGGLEEAKESAFLSLENVDFKGKAKELFRKEAVMQEFSRAYIDENYRVIAEAYREAGDEEKAKEFFIKAAKNMGSKRDYHTAAKLYREAGDEEKAKELSEKAATQDIMSRDYRRERAQKTESLEAYWIAAKLYREAGDEEKAKELFLKEAEGQERRKDYWGAAVAYREMGVEGKAKEFFLKEAAMRERGEDYWGAAVAYREAGDKEKAKDLFVKAIDTEKDVELTRDYRNVVKVYREIGYDKKARELLLRVAKKAEEENYYWGAAVAYRELSKLANKEKIKEILEKIKEL